MFTHKFLSLVAGILALSFSSTHGLLKGSISATTKTSIDAQGRNLVQQTVGSYETDTTAKAIGQNDCGIELSSANGYDDSFVILNEDMRCTIEDDDESAIIITASRITLDCQGHKLEDIGNGSGFGLVLLGDEIIVRNCEISSFENGIFLEASGSIMLQNVNSNNNSGDGLQMDDGTITSSLTILSSHFDNNGDEGIELRSSQLSKLFLSEVTANNNNGQGIQLMDPSTARLVDVEASNNGDEGFAAFEGLPNTKLVLHDCTFCGNGSSFFGGAPKDIISFTKGFGDSDFSGIGSFTHQAITCDEDDGNGICDCKCRNRVKAIGKNDCGIELSSTNGYDDSLVILKEDMICSTQDETESAIIITASRITLDCQGHEL